MRFQTFLLITAFFLSAQQAKAQSVAINTDGSAANASALLDVTSTQKGVLIPRMSRTERNAIAAPAAGLLVFQNAPDSLGFYYYTGTGWAWMHSNANADTLAWRTGGNTGTNANHFIGTADNRDLIFKRNNVRSGYISTTNTAWGANALNPASTGFNNTALGLQALLSNTTSSRNTAIGVRALTFNTTGADNTAIGMETLRWNEGNSNVAVGFRSLDSNTTGYSNAAMGTKSLISNTIGFQNSAVGMNALFSNTSGNNNVASGFQSLYFNTSGYNNTANGMEALKANTSGYNNTATGTQALFANTTGVFNTATGVAALSSNTTGYNNTAMGMQALNSNINGIFNTATGMASLFFNTSGSANTATGMDALKFNTIGYNNTATGVSAMSANTEGIFNTATGVLALSTNTTGSNNTAIGQQALNSNVSGSSNTALGWQAGFSATGSNNVFLGLQAGYNETGNNKLYIANNATNPPIIYGDFNNKTLGFGTITPNSTYGYAKVEIASEGFGAPADLLIRNAANDAGYAPGLIFQHARGTLATPTTVNNGDYLSAISTMNYDGTNYILSAGLDIYADGAIAAGIVPTKLQFNTMNTTGGYGARLTIKNDGKVGIGTTVPAARLDVAADFKLGTSGSVNNALIKSTQNIDVGSIPANSELDITVTVASANTSNSAVFVSPEADIEAGVVIAWARVSAANTVKIRFRNTTGSAIDPAAINYVISVLQ
ncbi:MAG: hypothetical protein IPI88_18935 [Chitinophagaceae bacterium]|nr:hypothetical protein [Chitinophagaceae bacterium]